MIVAVKRKDPKKLLIKAASIVAVIIMFYTYYNHMSEEFVRQELQAKQEKIEESLSEKKRNRSKAIERIIYREVETAVNLIGQEYVQMVKVLNRRILIVCDVSTNLEPLQVRYGSMALIRSDLNNIKIAIDLKYVIESKLNEENS